MSPEQEVRAAGFCDPDAEAFRCLENMKVAGHYVNGIDAFEVDCEECPADDWCSVSAETFVLSARSEGEDRMHGARIKGRSQRGVPHERDIPHAGPRVMGEV